MADMISSETASTVAAATGVLATIAGAILVPIRWVRSAIKEEREERIKADDSLRADIEVTVATKSNISAAPATD